MESYFAETESALFGEQTRRSIPIKNSSFAATALHPNKSGVRCFTSREATALLIAAKAGSVEVAPGAIIPREFAIAQQTWVIENGCGQDIVHSAAAGLIPGLEARSDRFVLSEQFCNWLSDRVSADQLSRFFSSMTPENLS